LANRPEKCTTGVGYWATDAGSDWNKTNASEHDGVLYRCTAPNVWTVYYTPYTYPHPLRVSGPLADDTQSISLNSGWNWVSFNVLPNDLSLNSVFSTILSHVEQVKTQIQSVIRSNNAWKGDLVNMNGIGQYKMFKVKVTQACTLTINGTADQSANPIPLGGGWNWVAYLPTTSMPIATALDSIKGQVQEVKSLTQSATYSGGAWSGTLTQLEPGQGYAIKMSGPGALTYPEGK
jgi:hypothetical protein